MRSGCSVGSAAGKLNDVRAAFHRDEPVDHASISRHVDVGATRAALGEAERAGEIAIGRDLDEAEAGVLFVVGADAAIEREALVGQRAVRGRGAGRLIELVAVEIADVGEDEVVEGAVLGALLTEVDPALLHDDLGIHDPPALRAEATSKAKKCVLSDAGHQNRPVAHTTRKNITIAMQASNPSTKTTATPPTMPRMVGEQDVADDPAGGPETPGPTPPQPGDGAAGDQPDQGHGSTEDCLFISTATRDQPYRPNDYDQDNDRHGEPEYPQIAVRLAGDGRR